MPSAMRSEDYPEGYWERAEGSNYRNYNDDPGWRTVLNVIDEWYAPGSRFIEMACAKGFFVFHARERGYDAVGFDISEYAIRKAWPKAKRFVQVHNAAEQWPYGQDEADVVFGFEFMEHVPFDEVDDVLMQAWCALKPGGRLILKTGIVIPDDHPFAGQEDHDHTHVTVEPREWWERVIFANGFKQTDADRSMQASIDEVFKDRDWFGRWFVWTKDTDDYEA